MPDVALLYPTCIDKRLHDDRSCLTPPIVLIFHGKTKAAAGLTLEKKASALSIHHVTETAQGTMCSGQTKTFTGMPLGCKGFFFSIYHFVVNDT